MAANPTGRMPGDDEPTRFIPRTGSGDVPGDDEQTRIADGRAWSRADDGPTEYIGYDRGGEETRADEAADADFAGGSRADSGAVHDDRMSATDGGQYWAPLTPEEQGYDATRAAEPRGYDGYDGYDGHDPRNGGHGGLRDLDDDGGRDYGRGGRGGGATTAIVGIVAIVAVLALLFWFLTTRDSGDGGAPAPTRSESPSAPSTTQPTEPSTTEPTPSEGPLQDQIDGLRDQIESIRQTPPPIPAVPGVSGGEATQQVIPQVVGTTPGEAELKLRRLGLGDITVLDNQGGETSTLENLTGRVASVEPAEGASVSTDTPITIRLR